MHDRNITGKNAVMDKDWPVAYVIQCIKIFFEISGVAPRRNNARNNGILWHPLTWSDIVHEESRIGSVFSLPVQIQTTRHKCWVGLACGS